MRLFLFLGLISVGCSLYEDQVGKFDWRKQLIGCPATVLFDSFTKSESLLVATTDNVFASISLNSGNINWRRLQENVNNFSSNVVKDSKSLFTLSDGGRLLRAWNKGTGALRWEIPINVARQRFGRLSLQNGLIFVLVGERAVALETDSGAEKWTVSLKMGSWAEFIAHNGNLFVASFEQGVITVTDIAEGQPGVTRKYSIPGDGKKCQIIQYYVVCAHGDTIHVININASNENENVVVKNLGSQIRKVQSLVGSKFAISTSSSTVVLDVKGPSHFNKILEIGQNTETISATENAIVYLYGNTIEITNLDGKKLIKKQLEKESRAAASRMFSRAIGADFEIVVVYEDCRMDLLVLSVSQNTVNVEWSREESLAHLISIEMVDLPLSESQQLIEDEFDEQQGNALAAFVHRIMSQLVQVQRWIVRTVNKMISLFTSFSSHSSSVAEMLDMLRSSEAIDSSSGPLERDYFNLRKMIIAVSLDGVVFGIDSSDGTVLWRIWLGKNFTPLVTSLGEHKVPLHIQRSTAHYQLKGQAVLAFKDASSGHGVLLFLNPITGEEIERKELNQEIAEVDLLPFTDKNHLYPIMVTGTEINDVLLFPSLTPEIMRSSPPIYMMKMRDGILYGLKLDLKTMKFFPLWNADLLLRNAEKMVALKGKPVFQKVHSQGRVLIDRNVQYKYNNPNLAVVATLDSDSQLLSIYFVDAVSGQFLHTSKLHKVLEPIHMVHCENWLAYSYWSEKGRRTEIGIIELYEGESQSTTDVFDSLQPTQRALIVNEQSYIYAQGINAMAVTETELGLTTRSILLSVPFGGIHEVSRKFLDANRPLELTQEMREEMMIPYMPELHIASEDMVNYNQTVFRIKGIKTASSGLESTSLMMAYGIDIFYTRLNPSGTFDILKDDFDHVLITLVLVGLFVGSVISKRMARNKALKAQWS